ncbi:hypothetical protein MRB53_027651 [Persea americana]|uniref:Uncharacterized protein n=1 Tax=Persea americana TaxID=3435 RepID=A0ACC2LLR1_PERAE|nr:hypothetical protein MRB53_027651 [Persea americana]
MAAVSGGTGFLIHQSLLLTTHVNLPSVAAAEAAADVRLQDRVAARLVPQRFFITSSVLDLTIVGLDTVDSDSTSQSQQPHYLKTCSNPSLDLGSVVYLLGHTEKKELSVGEGKVVIATDNLIKLSTDGVTWSPGSAGFDVQGNLAFMVCDPMKLASSPTAKSSTSSPSSSSWKKDLPMQFGIPIPIICDWLNQHWEGSLDDLTKPKLPLIRLMSSGQKSEHSCASFTLRRVFKPEEGENDDDSLSSQILSRPMNQPGSSSTARTNTYQEGNLLTELRPTHEQGISTPEIYESPRLTAALVQKKENIQPQLLDINFPPRVSRSVAYPLAIKQLLPDLDENAAEITRLPNPSNEDPLREETGSVNLDSNDEIVAVRSVIGDHSEVQSSSSPLEVSELQEGNGFHANYSSEGETMYSAETMESRNYTSPREDRFQQVGRSQSCMNYSRWSAAQRNAASRSGAPEKQWSLVQERKTYSQAAVSQRTRSHDYFSPTVSSIMKKRNSSEQLPRPRQSMVQQSPRWV